MTLSEFEQVRLRVAIIAVVGQVNGQDVIFRNSVFDNLEAFRPALTTPSASLSSSVGEPAAAWQFVLSGSGSPDDKGELTTWFQCAMNWTRNQTHFDADQILNVLQRRAAALSAGAALPVVAEPDVVATLTKTRDRFQSMLNNDEKDDLSFEYIQGKIHGLDTALQTLSRSGAVGKQDFDLELAALQSGAMCDYLKQRAGIGTDDLEILEECRKQGFLRPEQEQRIRDEKLAAALPGSGSQADSPSPLGIGEGSGAALIAAERAEQIHKHGFDVKNDADYGRGELVEAATTCIFLYKADRQIEPIGRKMWPWKSDFGMSFFDKITGKSDVEKLTVAGALIAAGIDRLLASAPLEGSSQKGGEGGE
jgi:hypothetical protein